MLDVSLGPRVFRVHKPVHARDSQYADRRCRYAVYKDFNTGYVFGPERPPLHVGKTADSKDLHPLRRTRWYHGVPADVVYNDEVGVLAVPAEAGRVVGTAVWLKPGRDMGPPITRVLFSGIHANLCALLDRLSLNLQIA